MSTRAIITTADLRRMAKVAKDFGVTVWVEVEGRKIGISPHLAGDGTDSGLETAPEDFTTLAQYEAWRERMRRQEEAS